MNVPLHISGEYGSVHIGSRCELIRKITGRMGKNAINV